MRLSHYRIKPLDEADIGPEIRSMLGDRFRVGPVPMIFRTIGRAFKSIQALHAMGRLHSLRGQRPVPQGS